MSVKKPENNGAAAREQATEFDSPFADRVLRFDDGTTMTIPPHPNLRMLDDDALEAYEAYLEEIETYDREPDLYIPEQTVKDRDGNEMVLPAETRPGAVKGPPYFKDGKRVSPPREVRIVQVVLGMDSYEVLRSKQINGRPAGARDVWRAWTEQGFTIAERAESDSKVMEAQWFWRLYPRQIASDLRRFFGLSVADWHQGRLSSLELLDLFGVRFVDNAEERVRELYVDFAPVNGAVARAVRGGRWSESELIAAETYNEIARFRASFHASRSRKAAYEPFAFEDPVDRLEKARASVEAHELQREVEADLFGW
ncbi:tail assembly chaperone [Mycobacterium phage Phatniss]|uniref:Tail assembly chaperone n=4 Tax=Cheoctovirus TaxID=1623281 RepID=A0A0K1Y7Q1_9CAUD|nr:tail assembly chaperone [Mycobacterium phage Phatniss]YP_009212654.1 tail assembly chaperone [Mycobacterium phage Dante]YP_009957524.1 tail assembly chaperone [Mycobacterium phage Gandalph]YP_009960388.1 tail assembly chaperone [Mycobacterium phage Nitzel]AWY03634.1 tail assembly chaperone [Mycobacterium phage Koella]AXC35559.1 tail assembly chaperone [Mycobacterium phage Clifton]QBP31694.1 tail assembly chaperone [Mycobacterium phage Piper2020]QKO03201.1 tail assembly chaperone [Mycobact